MRPGREGAGGPSKAYNVDADCTFVVCYGLNNDNWSNLLRNFLISTFIHYFSTFQQGCPFLIIIKATEDGEKLQVKKFVNEHNHPVNKVGQIIINSNSNSNKFIETFTNDVHLYKMKIQK
jgi:hypothetical protein